METIVKKTDYDVLKNFNFVRKPIGVKYSLSKPEGIKPTDKLLALCELINEAQTSRPFYATRENIQCGGGVMGLQEYPPMMYSGQLGPMFSMFKTPGANRRIYDYVPHLPKDSVKYVTCAQIDRMNFEPDLLVFTANVTQAEIILRASSFADGKMWHSKGTTCLACAWIFAHPFLSGEMNYTISGLGYSMKARKALPEGLIIITFAFDAISSLMENLNDMEWEPYWFNLGREGFVEEVQKRERELTKRLSMDFVQTTKTLKKKK